MKFTDGVVMMMSSWKYCVKPFDLTFDDDRERGEMRYDRNDMKCYF